jgi:hypothetical protein
MANVKRISADYGVTAHTVYVIIRREVDKYLLNDADGSFGAAPADPFVSLTEDGTIKGRYEKDESRAVWNNGDYDIVAYRQVGGSPSPVADTMVAVGTMSIMNDLELSHYLVYKDMALATNLTLVKTNTDKMTWQTIDAVTYLKAVAPNPSGIVIADVGNSGLSFKTDLTSIVTGFWIGAWCIFTSGALMYGPPKRVTSYDATEKALGFTSGFTSTPATSDAFTLIVN